MSACANPAERIALSPAELLAALARHEQQAAVLALAARRVEASGEWALDGSVSMASWLRHNARMSDGSAKRLVRRGRLLDRYKSVGDAALAHQLSAGQLDALNRVDQPKYEALFEEHQEVVVASIAPLSVAEATVVCDVWCQRADAVLDADSPPAEPIRELTFARAGDGALLGHFTLDAAAAIEVEKAFRNAATWEGESDGRTHAMRNGDALFDIAAFFNKNHDKPGSARHLPHVSLSVDKSTLDTGLPQAINDDDQRLVDPVCTNRYVCDCLLHTIIRDADGAPQSFGRSRYLVPRKLFREVAARDGGCRFPGCCRPVRFTEAHHIKWWRDMGFTEYMNLVLLCSRHHHVVHRERLELKLLPSGRLEVTWPDGRHRSSEPRGAPPKLNEAALCPA